MECQESFNSFNDSTFYPIFMLVEIEKIQPYTTTDQLNYDISTNKKFPKEK